MAFLGALTFLIPVERSGRQDISGAAAVPPLASATPLPPALPSPTPTVFPTPSLNAPPLPGEEIISSSTPNPPQPAALKLRGVEITQGIQVFNEPELPRCHPDPNHPNHLFCNNSIPLVAGRHTLVRVYLACNDGCPTGEVMVRLRLLKDGQEQANLTHALAAEALQRLNTLAMPELRAHLANSVNFEFLPPPAWLSGQITFELEAVPQGAVEQAPAGLSLTKDFAVRKPLRVAYLPIEYQGLRPPEPAMIDYWLLRMYPVSGIEYYRLPVPNLVWEGELSKAEILRKLLYTYWLYLQYQPVEAWPDQLFGWLPQEFYNGGAADPYWCPNCAGLHSSRVAFGGLRPEQDIGGPRILVHEIAHNLGAQHAWSPTQSEDAYCFKAEGVDISVDPDWPYAYTPHTQEFGIDLYSNPPIIYPPSAYDMMAYCAQPWISPHTYRKIFNSPFLQPETTPAQPLTDFKPQVETSQSGILLVSGVVYANGTVSQPQIIRLEGSAFTPQAAGLVLPFISSAPPGSGGQALASNEQDYCLEVQASDNTRLTRHCFEVGFLDLETGLPTESSPFFLALPEADLPDIARVVLTKDETTLVTLMPSNSPPQVSLTFPQGGEVLTGQQTLTWQASDADGDLLLYDVLYSPDGGQSWLPLAVRLNQASYTFDTSQVPASQAGLMRIIATDGFHTSMAEVAAPFTIEPPLANTISLVGPATVKPGQTFEVAVTAHRLAEPGLFGVQFKLNFDPSRLQVNHLSVHPDLSLVVDQTIQNEAGQVSVVASRQGQVDNLTGEVTLATLTFTAQQAGEVQLALSDLVAGARGGVRLDIPQVQGLAVRIAE